MLTIRDVKRVLEKNGYVMDRSKGSHAQFVKDENGKRHRVTLVINHLGAEMLPNYVRRLERDTGLKFK